jgi:hypothetical protein
MGVPSNPNRADTGLLDGSTVNATAPRFYDDSPDSFHPLPFDRFYLAEESILVPQWQLMEVSPTGRDKLSFPAVQVQDLVDSSGKRYRENEHFTINDGNIVWTKGPGLDPETDRGRIYSVRYLYRPHWYCDSLSHQIRVSQIDNMITGSRDVQRMPQAMVLHREHVYLKEKSDDEAVNGDTARQEYAPKAGTFGSR